MGVKQIKQDTRCGSGAHMTYQLRENNRITKIGSTVIEHLDYFPRPTTSDMTPAG
jgi:hypothetical protein